jgi:hypothetical protein
VAALAGLVALLAFVYSFFMNRQIAADELGFHNPIYMFVHYNTMTFPAYGYFNAMFAHPPTHYLGVALLMKAGLSLFHAAGVPPFLFTLLNTILVLRGRFPAAVKIGLLVGPYLAIFIWSGMITLRPELDLAGAWFAGLVALESARLDGWDARQLFLGSLLLTYAAGVHYVASIAFTGVLVYIVWACRDLGFAKAWPTILTIIAGGALFGVPYIVFFMLPNWHAIFKLAGETQVPGGAIEAVRMGLTCYRTWAGQFTTVQWHARPLLTALIFPLYWTLVPAAVLGPLLLLPYRSTRGIALAALPHLLFLWLYFRDPAKVGYFGYYVPEFMLYLSGAIIAILGIVLWVAERVIPGPRRWMVLPVLTPLVAAAVVANVPVTYGSSVSEMAFTPRLDDMEVARAAGMAMLGPGALVGSSDFAAWYLPGATHVYNAGQELGDSLDISHLDVRRYLSYFDALAQDARFDWSGMTVNKQHQTLTSWYIDGTLNLRGFYFGNGPVQSWSSELSYLLLTPAHRTSPLVGYVFRRKRLYEFQERPAGDTVLLTAVCSRPAPERMITNVDPHVYGFFRLSLPGDGPFTQQESVIKILFLDRPKYEAMQPVLAGECTRREEVWGSLEEVPVRGMLARLHEQDRPIVFYETLTDAIEAVRGVLVTPDAQPFRADRSAPVFAPDFTSGWEVMPAKPRVDVEEDPQSAKVTTNYSTYDQQLMSSAIPVSPRSMYLLEFDLKVARGGAGVQVMTSDRRITLAAHCEPASHRGFVRRRMFFETGDHSLLTVAVTNCASLGPARSVFWIRNMHILGQR